MGILIEYISVVAPKATIETKYPGGLTRYIADCPNGSFLCDDCLTRVGFMGPEEAEAYLDALEKKGLTFLKDGQCVDIVVIDMMGGPTAPCDWIEFQRMTCVDGFARHPYCWRKGQPPKPVVMRDQHKRIYPELL